VGWCGWVGTVYGARVKGAEGWMMKRSVDIFAKSRDLST